MAYKNRADQVAASRRSYEANKELIKERAKAFLLVSRKRNREFVDGVKDVPCTDCGNRYPPYVLQFDHLGTDKEFNIAHGVYGGYSIARLQAEIDKCEVVCANCHAVRTHTRRHSVTGNAPV